MRRLHRAAAVVTSLALVVAACGGDDDDAADDTPAVESTTGGPEPATSDAGADETAAESTEGGESTTPDEPVTSEATDADVDRDAVLRLGMELTGRVGFDTIAPGSGGASRSVYHELLYDTMIRDDVNNNPVPGLATEWSAPDDNTIELTLREGVTFHDGTPFDAEAVKFSWERCIAGEGFTKLPEHLAMESVDVLGPMEVRLNLNEPIAGAFLAWVLRSANYCMGIVSPTAVQELGDTGFEQAPVGAGPYRFVSYEPDQKIVLERVDGYWAPGNFARVELYNSTPGLPIVTGVASGAFDVGMVDAPFISQAEAAGVDVLPISSDAQTYMYLCQSDPLLSDLTARQAIAKVIDRDVLNEIAFEGRGTPNEVIIPAENPMHAADLFGGALAFDLDEARKLAEESGIAGQTLDLLVTASNGTQVALAESIQLQLQQIDVEVAIVPSQNAQADKASQKPQMDVWSLTPNTMATALEPGQINNYCENETPEVSEAYSQIWRSLPDDELTQVWHDYQKAVQDTLPLIPLVTDVRGVVYNLGDRLGGFRLKQGSYLDLRNLYISN